MAQSFITRNSDTRDEALAKARLIDAAPDLLGAVKLAESVIGRPMSAQLADVTATLRAAIAKAEGRS